MPTTITVEDATLQRFKRLKKQLDEQQDAPDHTNESFLKALMDTWEAADDGYYSEPSAEEIAEQLKNELSMANEPGVEMDVPELYERIDELEAAVKEATNAAQSAERTVEQMGPQND